MQTYNIHEAKTHLSRILEEVQKGNDVIIAKAGKPLARITPYNASGDAKPPYRKAGLLKGKIWMSPDFDAPDPELERLFYESEIFPSDPPKKQ